MRYYFVMLFIILNSISSISQSVNCEMESDIIFRPYHGSIADLDVYMFLQSKNDTSYFGYYFYFKIGKNINVSGELVKDSIYLYEIAKDSTQTAFMKCRYYNDSIVGKWTNLKTGKDYKMKLWPLETTGDIYGKNTIESKLVFIYNNKNYKFPISNYLDKNYNYFYHNVFQKYKNDKLYNITWFYYYPGLQRIRNNFQSEKSDKILVFSKFNEDGSIDTVQVVKTESKVENIQNPDSQIYGKYDSLNFEIYNIDKNLKYQLKFSSLDPDKGFTIKTSKYYLQVPPYLYETVNILDYELKIRYRYTIYIEEETNYYNVDKVSDKNRDISKIREICEYLNTVSTWFDEKDQIVNPDILEFSTDDYNFDGYDDIACFDKSQIPCQNYFKIIWLFNPQSGKYEKNKFLSELDNISVNKEKRVINSVWIGGASWHSWRSYKYINGKLILVWYKNESVDNDGIETTTTGELINNKWIEKIEE